MTRNSLQAIWHGLLSHRLSSTFALLTVWTLMVPCVARSQDVAKPAAETPVATSKTNADKPADTYSTRLFLTGADGSDPRQLTVLPEYTSQGSPEWSRDGKLICFDVWKTGGSVSTGRIAVVNADGTNPRIISDGVMPSFSPGGKRIAFSRPGQDRGVWIMSTEGPETELLQLDANGWGTSWAPDGRIVYSSHGAGGANLVVVNILEGTRELLFDEAKSPYQQIYWNMSWSPDSKRIVFKGINAEGKKEVGIVDARGESFGLIRRPFADVHESFTWTADGTRVLVTKPCPERENRAQVYSFNPDKDEPLQLLPNQEPLRGSTTAAASPDGKKLVLSCFMPVIPKAPAK